MSANNNFKPTNTAMARKTRCARLAVTAGPLIARQVCSVALEATRPDLFDISRYSIGTSRD
jgi:hypothetical protein